MSLTSWSYHYIFEMAVCFLVRITVLAMSPIMWVGLINASAYRRLSAPLTVLLSVTADRPIVADA